jgi:selenocysteine-specific elongation factor
MTHAPLTLGTAGHIDHGKTALIAALTGVDTDRLPEEHERGISIELGYATMTLDSGARLSVIDVPGHERYVRTMVAGATGIDLYLMTIAADDGVMPQTREHAAVLRALDVSRGVVAVTKSDLADPELAMLEAAELLPGAEVVAVSARTGVGLDELRGALARVIATLPSRAERPGAARLHIDRVFTIKGAGTVVTGTLWSGSIARGDSLTLLPGHRRARAREVQVHDTAVAHAAAGQRVAVNLSGLSLEEVSRGDVAVGLDTDLRETYLVDAELEFDRDLEPKTGVRVQIHHGTRESPARLTALGDRFWQLRLERPLIPAAGDRLVVRRIAPPDTLGGGRVLDPHPRKHRASKNLVARLTRLKAGEADLPAADVQPAEQDAPPPKPAPVMLPASALELEARLRAAGFEPPLDSELDAHDLEALREAGRAIRVTRTLHYHPDAIAAVKQVVVEAAAQGDGAITIAQLRDRLGTSRKFSQALLEHLDAQRVTIRRGDQHFVRARGVGG